MSAKRNTQDRADRKTTIFSRNSEITEFFELCIEPKTVKEKETVLLKFWEISDRFPRSINFCEIDIACMFVLDYVYKNSDISLTSVTRSLLAYDKQASNHFLGNPSFTRSQFSHLLNYIRSISNVYTDENCERILINSSVDSILDANMGLALFLIKFGLMEFPAEDDVKAKEMISKLISSFNDYMYPPEHTRRYVKHDDLVNRMRHCDIEFRRSLLVLCAITITACYYSNERDKKCPWYSQQMKDKCTDKMMCLDLVTSAATAETKIIYRDIENFIEKILGPLVQAEICSCIMESSRKLLDVSEFHNPRSLKDLARHSIRTSIEKQRILSEQVNPLLASDVLKQYIGSSKECPDVLKDYILFQREQIWDLLEERFNFVNLTKDRFETLIQEYEDLAY